MRRSRAALTLCVAVALLAALPALPAVARADVDPTPVTVHAGQTGHGAYLGPTAQGFSVESADLAHGYLSPRLLAKRLDTLGPHGVLRVGGYSMDLVWPAFGKYTHATPPPQAIGGRVDLGDLRKLDRLSKVSGWKVTIGLPFKAVIDQAQVKDTTKDPAPALTLDQVMTEVKAAHRILGDRLAGVEVGNEYDNITTLTAAEMWTWTRRYRQAVAHAVPGAGVKVIAPSSNTATTNTRLEDYVTAASQDPIGADRVVSEISSHYYPTSHCGTSNATIAQLLSAKTYATTQAKVDGIAAQGTRLGAHRVPMTINESNSSSCSGQPGVSNSYAVALWALDYQLQVARAGVSRVQFHTSTRAVCGDFKPRTSPEYPISYRYYGAFCARNASALARRALAPMPLYYGLWAFRQVGTGRFTQVDVPTAADGSADPTLHAYAVQSGRGAHRRLTVVLVDLADRTTTGARTVRLAVPAGYRHGRALTLRSSAAAGLGSLDVDEIRLGGRYVRGTGAASGALRTVPVGSTLTLAPGSARIVTFTR